MLIDAQGIEMCLPLLLMNIYPMRFGNTKLKTMKFAFHICVLFFHIKISLYIQFHFPFPHLKPSIYIPLLKSISIHIK
jgi:hypothetical protein